MTNLNYVTPFGGAELKLAGTIKVHSAPPNGGQYLLCESYKHFIPNGMKNGVNDLGYE